MQQPYEREVTVYADITEVRMETRAANYKKLIAEGWVMLGAYPLTMVGDEARGRRAGSNQSSSLRTPSSVCTAWLAMSWERNGNRKSRRLIAVLGLSSLR